MQYILRPLAWLTSSPPSPHPSQPASGTCLQQRTSRRCSTKTATLFRRHVTMDPHVGKSTRRRANELEHCRHKTWSLYAKYSSSLTTIHVPPPSVRGRFFSPELYLPYAALRCDSSLAPSPLFFLLPLFARQWMTGLPTAGYRPPRSSCLSRKQSLSGPAHVLLDWPCWIHDMTMTNPAAEVCTHCRTFIPRDIGSSNTETSIQASKPRKP